MGLSEAIVIAEDSGFAEKKLLRSLMKETGSEIQT
jgi:hypothetical protein